MNSITEYIIHNQEHSIVICRQCKFAIPPGWIPRHFRESHSTIPIDLRNKINQVCIDLQLNEPDQILIPREECEAIEGLELMNGFKCGYDDCGKYTKTNTTMKKHCRAKHGWVTSMKEMWESQMIQTFFQAQHCKCDHPITHADSRYFPVTVESEPDSTLIQNLITSLLNNAKTKDENHQRELNKVPENSELVTLTPWLRRTRWHERFAGRNMEQLIKLTEKPDLNDHMMFGLWRNVGCDVRASIIHASC